jgi:hypothetical protein
VARRAALLLQEPWGFHPDQVARLTPWQVETVYLTLARELAREAEGKGGPGEVEDQFEKGLPPRAEFVAAMMGTDGGSSEHWNAVYDRLDAEMKANGNAPKPARQGE